jgi:cyclic dehypoxanthinyl futalosine synthase
MVERLTIEKALEWYHTCSLHELARRAAAVTERFHPASKRSYVIERNINYTNVCRTRCAFCAFSVSPKNEQAYTLDVDQISRKIDELIEIGGTQILLQGGMHPDLPFAWYEHMLQEIRRRFPGLHIHAFSPPEIIFFSQHFGMSIAQVLQKLKGAGLDSVPGGGAEILVDRVRRIIAPAKCTAGQWLDVMRQAHQLGISTTATMMFGHVETVAERFEHLAKIRQLQDESLARRRQDPQAGVFTAFTCWPFQPGHTRLAGNKNHVLSLAGAYEQLKMTSLARLFLDNIPNHQASWVTQGPEIGQLSLLMGCNDAGSLMMEENVVAAAGTGYAMRLDQLRRLISEAGFEPVQRDYYYHFVG